MKQYKYKTLAEAKRSLATQVLALTIAAVLISVTGRLMVRNRFPVSHVLSYDTSQVNPDENLTISWQKEEMTITEKEVVEVDNAGSGDMQIDTAGPGDERTDKVADAGPGDMRAAADDSDDAVDDWIDGGKILKDWAHSFMTRGGRYSDEQYHANILHVTMLPKKTGKYVMKVLDQNGKEILKDEIFVGRFRTAFSRQTGSFTGDESLILAGILYFAGLMIIMLGFFKRLEGPLSYSYEAILSCGIFVFSLIALIIEVPVYINHLLHPDLYPAWQVICDIAAGGKYFTILTSPLMILFAVLLIISNIELLRHERVRFQNVLGLLLGIILIIGEIVYYLIYSSFHPVSQLQHFIVVSAENIIGITFTYFECILFASLLCGFWAAEHVPAADRDYILILGCGFRKDGSLPPLLRGRVDKAMEFWYKQKEKTGKEAVIIPSGGQGQDEVMSESQAMYQYMVSSGFPEKAIMREEKSANTYQNMEFSKALIEKMEKRSLAASDDPPVNTAFVTTNYHVFRSGVWAGLAGLPAEGLGSDTVWWFWPNAFIRECAGLFMNRLIPELIGLGLLVLCFAAITWLAYL